MLLSLLRPIAGRSIRRRKLMSTHASGVLASECLEQRQLLAADMVLQWNDVLLDAVRVDKTAPPKASRAMAIVHTAIFDAVNSIDRTYTPYVTSVNVHPRASKEAAVVSAAYEALVSLFPAQSATFAAERVSSLATIADGRAENSGVKAGKSVAAAILAQRATDGSTATVTYTAGTKPGDWQPTPPAFASPLLPQWPDVQPWTMTSGARFRPVAPPVLNSPQYAADFNEVKAIGSATSTTRTVDQTEIALFWANGPGTSTPPGHWNVIAQTVAESKHISLEENARLFAMLNLALADAAIVSWDAKYEFDLWRPVTAIQQAATDGNARTTANASWTPLLVTPPFSSYTSGHSTFSGAGAAVLKGFFGTDRVGFELPSETIGVANRRFSSFSQAAVESGMSRIYGGIHFNFDNTAGLESGERLGNFVVTNFLKPDAGTSSARIVNGELFVNGTSRSDNVRIRQRSGMLNVTANGTNLGSFATSQVTRIIVDAADGDDFVRLMGVTVSSELYGGRGSDRLHGGLGNDRIFGDEGNDRIFGEDGNDRLFGEEGDDRLYGRKGSDVLDGGLGRDTLRGNTGNDTLRGFRGLDRLFGGLGLDELLWTEVN